MIHSNEEFAALVKSIKARMAQLQEARGDLWRKSERQLAEANIRELHRKLQAQGEVL